MLDHLLVDLIGAIRRSLDDTLLQRQAVEERFQVDVFLGDVSWETSYSLPGEEQPPRVRADISLDWPTWSQTAYRSWSIGETPDEPPEVVLEVALRIQRLAEAPPTAVVLGALPARSPVLAGEPGAGGGGPGNAPDRPGSGRRAGGGRGLDPLAELTGLDDLDTLAALESLDALGGLAESARSDSDLEGEPAAGGSAGGGGGERGTTGAAGEFDVLGALDPLGRFDDDPMEGRLVRISTTIEQAHNDGDDRHDPDLTGGGGPDGEPDGRGSPPATVRWAVEATYEGTLRFDEEQLEDTRTLAPMADALARWLASTLVQLADLPLRFVPADPLGDG